jgi:hypothetical protein
MNVIHPRVIAGFDPAIHLLSMDPRDTPAGDGPWSLLPR